MIFYYNILQILKKYVNLIKAKKIFTGFNLNMITAVNRNYPITRTNFTSRNPEIRRAEDIVRKVNNAYPRVSSSKIDNYSNIDNFKELDDRYKKKTMQFRNDIDNQESPLYPDLVNLKILPRAVSEEKFGNCAEALILTGIAAKINGFENFEPICFDSSETGEIDHTALLVSNNNKPYIMDAWLGIADYVPNVIEKYKGEYSYLFDLNGNDGEKIEIVSMPWYKFDRIYDVSKEDLKKAFPELMLPKNKKNNVFAKIKQKFTKVFNKQDSV